MEPIPILSELTLVAVVGVAVTVILSRLQRPTVAGLLASGALMGPSGFGLIHSMHDIEVLAEVGVVLLLFTIGLEFSFGRLKRIFRQVALGGALQVGLTAGLTTAVCMSLGQPLGRSIFFGFVVALSSTAIVLRTLAERQELDAPHGRFIVGTLIFQDLCVVPMVLIVPLLSEGQAGGDAMIGLGIALGKAVVVVAAILGLSRFVVPKMLGWVDASRSREVFLLAILAICIGTAWLTSLVGLSLALGAFLGGMVVADTEYGHRAMSDILPLRHAFVSLFFILLGMLFDVATLMEQPLLVLGLLLAFVVVKGFIATVAALAMRFPARVAWLAGVGLAQFGEFGFVLVKLGQQSGVVTAQETSPLLAAGILSMFLTPLLVRIAPHVRAGERLLAPLERLIGVQSIDDFDQEDNRHTDHVVIVGFGVAGMLASQALSDTDVPHVVLELNADNVEQGRALGLPVYYGDATSEEALQHAWLQEARLLVLLLNDSRAAERIADTAKRVAPDVPILMRTRYLTERESLVAVGIDDVVAEEVEGAVEIVSRMLRRLEVPRNIIDEQLLQTRKAQPSDQKRSVPASHLGQLRALAELHIEHAVVREGSPLVGKSAIDLKIRSKTGALVVAVQRGDSLRDDPDPHEEFEVDDIVFLVGKGAALSRALAMFEPTETGGSKSSLRT